MSLIAWTLCAWTVPMCLLWAFGYGGTPLRLRKVRRLSAESPPPPSVWPRLSVVVPACDEAETLEPALTSLLAQDYPNLEILLVDDRSTDGTGAIIDRLAAADPRVRAIHITELPRGWLGKVHALHTGADATSGDWILFTDADIHFAPGLLRRAVAFAAHEGLDHLALLPDFKPRGFLLQAMQAAFFSTIMMAGRAHEIGEPGSKAFAGVGAFNLVRRSKLASTPGLSWLRMEVGDDLGLGLLLHRAGAKVALRLAHDELAVEWYPSTLAMVKGLEKNSFGAMCGYSFVRLPLALAFWLAILLAPFGALAAPLVAPELQVLPYLGAAALLGYVVCFVDIARVMKTPLLPGLCAITGQVVLMFTLVRAAYFAAKQRGIRWRGTHYGLDELRAGQRLAVGTFGMREVDEPEG